MLENAAAMLLIAALKKDGIDTENYIEERRQRYRKEVERGAIKKSHVSDWEPPKVYGKKKPRKTIEQKSIKDLVGELKRYATKD